MSTTVEQPSLWTDAVRALRVNLLPGVVLWLIATTAVLSYYFVDTGPPRVRGAGTMEGRGRVSVALQHPRPPASSRGWIPFFVSEGAPDHPKDSHTVCPGVHAPVLGLPGFGDSTFSTVFRGCFSATKSSVGAVAAKVALDLLVYNVIWAANLRLGAYQWKNSGLGWAFFRQWPSRRHWTHDLPVAPLSTWLVWSASGQPDLQPSRRSADPSIQPGRVLPGRWSWRR